MIVVLLEVVRTIQGDAVYLPRASTKSIRHHAMHHPSKLRRNGTTNDVLIVHGSDVVAARIVDRHVRIDSAGRRIRAAFRMALLVDGVVCCVALPTERSPALGTCTIR